jgi:excisionase family DNA binding protein
LTFTSAYLARKGMTFEDVVSVKRSCVSMPDVVVAPPDVTLSKRLLDVREVAAILGCGRTYVYELIGTRALPAIKLGRLTRIPVGAVDDFVTRKLSEPMER